MLQAQHGFGGRHRYSFADTGLDLTAEREKFAAYLARYDIPPEVVAST